MLYTALVTAFALILYLALTMNVGKARGTYGVKAPATTGNEAFERVYRTQMNTLEQLVFFLPSLWLFSNFLEAPKIGALIGLVWIGGRILFARDYYAAAEKRGRGFIISGLASVVLLLGGIVGIVGQLLGY